MYVRNGLPYECDVVGIILPSLRVMFVQIASRAPLPDQNLFVPDKFRWGDLEVHSPQDDEDVLLGPMDEQMELVEEAMGSMFGRSAVSSFHLSSIYCANSFLQVKGVYVGHSSKKKIHLLVGIKQILQYRANCISLLFTHQCRIVLCLRRVWPDPAARHNHSFQMKARE